jgi:hypothetical protein
MADAQHQFEPEVRAAHECAEAATWTTNELVGRTLETAVTGKEAATTLHHAYSAQVHVARVLDWSKAPAQAEGEALSNSSPPKLDDCLAWMQRARNHAEKLCGCFPASEKVGDSAPRIAEWAQAVSLFLVAAGLLRSEKQGRRVIDKNRNCHRGNRAAAAN